MHIKEGAVGDQAKLGQVTDECKRWIYEMPNLNHGALNLFYY
jgi:hypothetical protein